MPVTIFDRTERMGVNPTHHAGLMCMQTQFYNIGAQHPR